MTSCSVCGLPLELGEQGCIYTVRPHARPIAGLKQIGDEIDETIENLSHEPIRFRSRSEKRAYMKATGQSEFVRHVGEPGSDKSRHTTRWI